MVINEIKLKQRFNYGDWSLETMNDLLDLNGPAVRDVLMSTSSITQVAAIHNESKETKEHFLNNCSKRLSEQLVEEMNNADFSLAEIQSAQLELLSVAREQVSLMEQKLWDEMLSVLPTDNLPEGDINLIYSLNSKLTKQWMDKVSTKQQIQILTDDEASEQFWVKRMQPIIGEKAAKVIESNWEQHEPQFSWEIQIARSIVTWHVIKLMR